MCVAEKEGQALIGRGQGGEKLMGDEDEETGVMWIGMEKQEMR